METEMADLFIELNRQRDHNDLMRDKVSHLEMSLEHSKVFSNIFIVKPFIFSV